MKFEIRGKEKEKCIAWQMRGKEEEKRKERLRREK